MLHTISILTPIFLLILLGYIFKRFSFPSLTFWPMLDRVTYFIIFPSLLTFELSSANFDGFNGLNIILVTLISIACILLITIFSNIIKRSENSSFTSILQGSIRFNSYIFLSIVDATFGDEGLVIAALVMAIAIPVLNFLCIGAFSYYVHTDKLSLKSFSLSILKNPLIMACVVGVCINLSGIYIPLFITNTLQILGSAALPLGLLSVGVGLEFASIGSAKYSLFISTVLKLIAFPIVMLCVVDFFEISHIAVGVLLLFASMPTATSSYILARQLGGDIKLISSIITLQTLISIVTIAAVIEFLNIK